MKKVFELHINGKFSQFLLPSEIKLLKWDSDRIFTLKPVEITMARYKIEFGK
jgi:hypothetical protein